MKTRILTAVVALSWSTSSLALRSRPTFSRIMLSSSSSASPSVEKHVLVPIGNGSEEIESVTIIDTLVRGGAKVTVASVADSENVVMSRGVKMSADVLIEDCVDKKWDMIALPGGMPGAEHLRDSPALIALLEKHRSENAPIAAMCAAPAVVLASKGFLKDKTATCYPADKFRSMLPNASDQQIVVDGNIITSQGPGDSLNFALKLVEILFGSEKSKQIGKEMLAI